MSGSGPKEMEITIRTPAGISSEFSVRTNDRVDKVAREAVKHFVSQQQLAAGEYGLALIREGRATDLTDSARLEDYEIVEGDVLSLIAKEPQVDG